MPEISLPRRIASVIARHGMARKGDLLLVGVSGGADSMCLLHVLRSLGHSLVVVHLHHGIRGAAADEDAAFVQQTCEALRVSCVVERRDVPGYQRSHHLSLETAAREVRHAVLREVAAARGASAIFLAHTADDQVETFLMRLIRGAGMAGLGAMRPKQGLLCRPMLDVWRSEVEAYLRTRGVGWKEDSGNEDERFLRNRVRHELIPLLLQLNPGVKEVLLREARLLRGRQRRLEAEVLRQFGLSGRQIEQAVAGKAVVLAGGRRFSFRSSEPEPPSFEIQLPVPGEVALPGVGVITASSPMSMTESPKMQSEREAVLDADLLEARLCVRSRRPGDRLVPLGMRDEKKLQDFLVDEKVPRPSRGRIPIVVSNATIVWVAGLRIDDRFKVTPSTRHVVRLTFQPQEPSL